MYKVDAAEEPDKNPDAIKFSEPAPKWPQAGFAFENDSGDLTDEAHPGLITKHQLVLLTQLCKKLESYGVTQRRWRDQIEHLSGLRSRKALTAGAAVKVISSFAHTLNRLVANESN